MNIKLTTKHNISMPDKSGSTDFQSVARLYPPIENQVALRSIPRNE